MRSPRSTRISKQAPYNGEQITNAQAALRLFPEVAQLGVGTADMMLPGRYWTPWGRPPQMTDLDRVVESLIKGDSTSKILPRDELEVRGIFCPYYAVRAHTIFAASRARHTQRTFHRARRDTLENERERWVERVRLAEDILKHHKFDDAVPAGSIYLSSSDFDNIAELSARDARKDRFSSLRREIALDKEMISLVDQEIDRIKNSKLGTNTDTWATTFYIYMANVWSALTDKPVPASTGAFYEILRAATLVLSGGDRQILEWGQAKTLRERFRDAPSGEGFRIHERGELDLDSVGSLEERGEELKSIIEVERRTSPYSPLYMAAISGAITLVDHCEGDLEIILRALLIRPLTVKLGILSDRLLVQLGWVAVPEEAEILSALGAAAAAIRDGDVSTAVVLELVSRFNEDVRQALAGAGILELVRSYAWDEAVRAHEEFERMMDEDNSHIDRQDFNGLRSTFRAFNAAMIMRNIIGDNLDC